MTGVQIGPNEWIGTKPDRETVVRPSRVYVGFILEYCISWRLDTERYWVIQPWPGACSYEQVRRHFGDC